MKEYLKNPKVIPAYHRREITSFETQSNESPIGNLRQPQKPLRTVTFTLETKAITMKKEIYSLSVVLKSLSNIEWLTYVKLIIQSSLILSWKCDLRLCWLVGCAIQY